jgi:hypothetical protein
MSIAGWILMIASISFVIGLTAWCYYCVLTSPAPEHTTEPPETLGG